MKTYFKILLSALAFTFASATVAEKKTYEEVNPPQATNTGDKIEVIEFFWYGCSHCYQFEPFVESWAKSKPDNVEFIKIPTVLNPQWTSHAKAYYAAELLGIEEKFTHEFFEALHKERKRIYSQKDIAEFAKNRLGVNADDFMDAMSSFAVETKIRRSKQLSKSYGLTGVPTVIVNGKYRTDAGLARGHAGVVRTIESLVAKESK
jgi:thiol:disulfide interchange protein DsbA